MLNEYIGSQKVLLEKALQDMECLKQLKYVAKERPANVWNDFWDTDADGGRKRGSLGELYENVKGRGGGEIINKVDWELYGGKGACFWSFLIVL